jgi:hypothetical protein
MIYDVNIIEPSSRFIPINWTDVMIGDGTIDDRGDVRLKISAHTYLIFCNKNRNNGSFQVWGYSHWTTPRAKHCKITLKVEATINA